MPNFCGDCGSELVEGKKFCMECGAKVVVEPKKKGKKKKGKKLECKSCGTPIDDENEELECLDCGKSFCDTCESEIKKIEDFEGVSTDFDHPLCEVCYGKSFVEQLPRLEEEARNLKVSKEKERRKQLQKKRKKKTEEPRPYTPDLEEAEEFEDEMDNQEGRYASAGGHYYFPEEKYEVYEPEDGPSKEKKGREKKATRQEPDEELDLIAKELINAIGEDESNPYFSEDYDVDEDLDDIIREGEEELSKGKTQAKGRPKKKRSRGQQVEDQPEGEWDHSGTSTKRRRPGRMASDTPTADGRVEMGQWGPPTDRRRRYGQPGGPPPHDTRRQPPYDPRYQEKRPPYDAWAQDRPPHYDPRGPPPGKGGYPNDPRYTQEGKPPPPTHVVKKKVIQKKRVKKVAKKASTQDPVEEDVKVNPTLDGKVDKKAGATKKVKKQPDTKERPKQMGGKRVDPPRKGPLSTDGDEPEEDLPEMELYEEIPEMEQNEESSIPDRTEDQPAQKKKVKKGGKGKRSKKK